MKSPDMRGMAEVLIFGEVLFDCLLDQQALGGAPFNVAWALSGFGLKPILISAVGDDALGNQIRSAMAEWYMPLDELRMHPGLSTGKVQVTFHDDEPQYYFDDPSSWDQIKTDGLAASRLIYHGSLALRHESNRKSLRELIEQSRGQRFFDVNLREPYDDVELVQGWMHEADWVKLNLDELRRISGQDSISFENAFSAVDALRHRFEIGSVILTGGEAGALVRSHTGIASLSRAPAVKDFADSVGAGDALASVMIFGILNDWTVDQALETAASFAAKVCGLSGAISRDPAFYSLV